MYTTELHAVSPVRHSYFKSLHRRSGCKIETCRTRCDQKLSRVGSNIGQSPVLTIESMPVSKPSGIPSPSQPEMRIGRQLIPNPSSAISSRRGIAAFCVPLAEFTCACPVYNGVSRRNSAIKIHSIKLESPSTNECGSYTLVLSHLQSNQATAIPTPPDPQATPTAQQPHSLSSALPSP